MKNILFVMPSLGSGGAEKSLVNLLNLIDYEKYAVDLLLFKREGLFLSQIPKEVRLLQPADSLQYAYKIDRGMFSSVSGLSLIHIWFMNNTLEVLHLNGGSEINKITVRKRT